MPVTALAPASHTTPTPSQARPGGPARGFVLTVDLSATDDLDPAEVLRSIATLAELTTEWFPRSRARAALTGDAEQPVPTRPGLRHRLDAIGDHTEVEVDPHTGTVRTGGRETRLTGTETALLAYLAGAGDRTVTRDELLDAVWRTGKSTEARTVDTYVRRLRAKTGLPWLVVTVWGSGYRLDPRYHVRVAA